MLNWEILVHGNDPKIWVKGTEIERCCPDGFRHRFAIYSVRVIGWEVFEGKGFNAYDVRYRVRDAEAISDADVKAGKPCPIFGEYATLDEALAAIEPHRVVDEYEK